MSGVIDHETSQQGVSLSFDESLYDREVVFGAAYTFLDRCYVHLDREGTKIVVRLRPKVDDRTRREAWDAETIAGEFESEALSQAWRRELLRENRDLLEKVTARVLAGAAGPAGLDDLLGEELAEVGDAFDDPLGIAVSWEEKYGSQKQDDSVQERAVSVSESESDADDTREPNS